jgi:hypothetical protein
MNALLPVLGVAVVAVAIIWVFTSSSPLAEALRAQFKSKEKQAADHVDQVQARLDSAVMKKDALIAMARQGTYQVNIKLAEAERMVQQYQGQLDQAQQDKQLAFKAGNRTAFAEACREVDRANTQLAGWISSRDQIKSLLANMRSRVDQEYDEKSEMEEEAARLAANDTVNQASATMDEAAAHLGNTDDGSRDMEKARQMVGAGHDRGVAAHNAATQGLSDQEQAQKDLKALRAQATATNADAEWARMEAEQSGKTT